MFDIKKFLTEHKILTEFKEGRWTVKEKALLKSVKMDGRTPNEMGSSSAVWIIVDDSDWESPAKMTYVTIRKSASTYFHPGKFVYKGEVEREDWAYGQDIKPSVVIDGEEDLVALKKFIQKVKKEVE